MADLNGFNWNPTPDAPDGGALKGVVSDNVVADSSMEMQLHEGFAARVAKTGITGMMVSGTDTPVDFQDQSGCPDIKMEIGGDVDQDPLRDFKL